MPPQVLEPSTPAPAELGQVVLLHEENPSPPLRMTWEEYLDWMDEDKHAEWVNGEVIMHSPVSTRHDDLDGFLSALLRFYVEEKKLGRVGGEPFLMKVSPDLPGRLPDIFFVATANLSRIKENLLNGPADLVVEIISPESRSRDRGEKFYEYEAGGVGEYWMLDGSRKKAEFHQRGADGLFQPILPDASGTYHSAVLPGFFLQVDWLWQTPLPSLVSVLKTWSLIP